MAIAVGLLVSAAVLGREERGPELPVFSRRRGAGGRREEGAGASALCHPCSLEKRAAPGVSRLGNAAALNHPSPSKGTLRVWLGAIGIEPDRLESAGRRGLCDRHSRGIAVGSSGYGSHPVACSRELRLHDCGPWSSKCHDNCGIERGGCTGSEPGLPGSRPGRNNDERGAGLPFVVGADRAVARLGEEGRG
jgi:hypothetical protein